MERLQLDRYWPLLESTPHCPYLEHKRCQPYVSDMQVKVGSKYFYPDVLVDCSNLSDESTFTETPILIIEVLSKSTRRTDETTKRMAYMPSLVPSDCATPPFVNAAWSVWHAARG